jgi:ATP-binding cassette subfamily B protein
VHLSSVSGRIELQDVGFRYGTRSVTRDISLAIEPGEMIASSVTAVPARARS